MRRILILIILFLNIAVLIAQENQSIDLLYDRGAFSGEVGDRDLGYRYFLQENGSSYSTLILNHQAPARLMFSVGSSNNSLLRINTFYLGMSHTVAFTEFFRFQSKLRLGVPESFEKITINPQVFLTVGDRWTHISFGIGASYDSENGRFRINDFGDRLFLQPGFLLNARIKLIDEIQFFIENQWVAERIEVFKRSEDYITSYLGFNIDFLKRYSIQLFTHNEIFLGALESNGNTDYGLGFNVRL